jgi:hypothetical protein
MHGLPCTGGLPTGSALVTGGHCRGTAAPRTEAPQAWRPPEECNAVKNKRPAPLTLRTWRVAMIRQHFLGFVEAPDPQAAKAAAVEAFKLTDEQRKRLVVQQRRGRRRQPMP